MLATKFTTCFPDPRNPPRQKINYAGNSTKSLRVSVEASLKKLQTDYIDLLYVHWWDFTTSVAEVMQSLNQLVQSGKVLYLGVSDTPAWVVSKANECMYTVSTLLLRSLHSGFSCTCVLIESMDRRPQPRPPPILRLPRPMVCRLP